MLLSIIIPSYKDPLLIKTIDSILENAEGEIEIIAVLDGYWPEFELRIDPRVRYVHLGKNRGMRGAINAGVLVSRGEYIMRSDEHCMYSKNFDKIITDNMEDNWIVTATRYFLDPIKWERIDIPPFIYEKLKIRDDMKFEGVKWRSRDKERKDIMIDETMAMQGSFWIMKRSWWDKVIVELDTEHYGPMYQDSHEMIFKTWQVGGKMMVNKNTWFAHKHVSFPRTHRHGSQSQDPHIKYCLDTWKDYYEKEIVPLWFPS